MDISGKIIKALEVRSGVSQRTGNKWMSQQFVIETHDQYPRHCVFSVFGEERLKQFDIKVGEELLVSFDIDAREYQGRWYNDITAWRVQRGGAPVQEQPASYAAAAPVQPTQAAAPVQNFASEEGTADDLPF